MTQKHSFVKGMLILSFAGISVRFIGAGFRILLAALIGDEGIGLYQMAYPVYSALLALSTAGMPIAISKLVSQYITTGDYRGAYRVFRLSLYVLGFSGLLITMAMFLGAEFIAERVAKDSRAYYPLIAIAPAIFFVTVMSAWRGFFQGQQKMLPTGLSQLFEQIVRVGVALGLVFFLFPLRLEWAAAGATFGAAAGGMAGLLTLLIIYKRQRQHFFAMMSQQKVYHYLRKRQIFYSIFALSLPITLGHLVMPLIGLVDMMVIPMRLAEVGFDETRRMALYGQLTGMAMPVIYIPAIITVAMAVSLVPAISEALALNNFSLIRSRVSLALRLTLLLGLPSAAGLFILAEPITWMLFNNREASVFLAVMAPGVIFLTLYQTTAGILQGLGKTRLPVIHLFIGALTKLALNWFLTGIPVLNIRGAAIASVTAFLIASLLNLYRVKAITGIKINYSRLLFKPFFAVTFMGLAAYLGYAYFLSLFGTLAPEIFSLRVANALATFIAIGVGIIFYAISLLILGILDKDDLVLLPRFGPKVLVLARKLRLIKY